MTVKRDDTQWLIIKFSNAHSNAANKILIHQFEIYAEKMPEKYIYSPFSPYTKISHRNRFIVVRYILH